MLKAAGVGDLYHNGIKVELKARSGGTNISRGNS